MTQIITTNGGGGGGGGGVQYEAGVDISISGGIDSISGANSVTVEDAVSLVAVYAYGGIETSGTPTPTSPITITSNNGVLKVDGDGNLYADGTVEKISDAVGNSANAEILLSMFSYKDEQNLTTGEITRNVKAIVLNGSEGWTKSGTTFNADLLDGNMFSHLICTHFVDGAPINDNVIYKSAGSSTLQIRYDTASTVEDFEQFLSDEYNNGTPVIVLYAPETPEKESVSPQTLELDGKNGTFTISEASINGLEVGADYRIPGNIIDFTNETGYITKADLPTKVSELENDAGYVDSSALSGYQTVGNMVCNLTNADNTHYPSAKAVADALQCAGAGDMMKVVYDPNNCNSDAFNYDNFYNTPTIPTDNSELANGCGYAKSCDIPTDNCQLANGCGYTTCTGTLTASNISNTAYGSSWSGVTTVAPSKNAVYAKVNSIDALIPSAATSSNQLTDKNYVDDSINSVTAYYITKNAQGDQWATYAELAAATTFYSGGVVRVPTRNDYTVVLDDETHGDATTRYSYQGSGWQYQYTINESPMTQAQLDALNSGITAAKVSSYDGAVSTIGGYGNIVTCDASAFATAAQGTKADTALQSGDNITCLTNDAGYTTCTGTLNGGDLKTVNGCCLVGSGNIQIDGAFDGTPYLQCEYNALPASKDTDGIWRLIYE